MIQDYFLTNLMSLRQNLLYLMLLTILVTITKQCVHFYLQNANVSPFLVFVCDS